MALDRKLVAAARGANGAAIAQLADAEPQPFGFYWNKYGERFWLPQDEFSLLNYKRQGLTLNRPSRPAKRAAVSLDPAIAATQQDWDGVAQGAKTAPGAAPALPTATYYTPAGTSFAGLIDPDSMLKY